MKNLWKERLRKLYTEKEKFLEPKEGEDVVEEAILFWEEFISKAIQEAIEERENEILESFNEKRFLIRRLKKP